MAATSHVNTPRPAPWKQAFDEHLSKMSPPEFVFTTVQPAPEGSVAPYVPRARYCIFRGFWAELPENKHNAADKNPRVYESEMPTFTSDVRMGKVEELFRTGAGRAESEDQWQGSGGGGPVEAVWWVKETQTQWRIKGQAFVVGPDIEEESDHSKMSSGVRTVKSELGARMRIVAEGKEGEWSWARELTAHFGNNSPGLRGSFKYPPPGKPTDTPYDDRELTPGAKCDDLDDPVARKNFRVVVIRPDEVERNDQSEPATSRRQLYTYDDSTHEWSHRELFL